MQTGKLHYFVECLSGEEILGVFPTWVQAKALFDDCIKQDNSREHYADFEIHVKYRPGCTCTEVCK